MARKKKKKTDPVADPSVSDAKGGGEEPVEGGEGLAGEEPSAGTLAPSDELEAALKEASDALQERESQGPAEASGSSELQTLKTELEAVQSELEKVEEQHLRLQAEFENFRRRSLKEKQETQLYGHQNLIKELLPTVDNLDRAIEHSEQSASEDLQQLLQGVELVRRELLGALERFGVSPIEAEGAAFDPAFHEAMVQVPSAEVEPNTVVAVMESGYQLRDRMLRPARVVVSKAPDEPQPEPDSDE